MLALDAALTADRPASLSPDLNAERRSADEDQGRDGQGPDGGRYTQGVYSCCAKGEGTACCEGKGQGACFAYGGIYKDCVSAGGEIEGKVICGLCCPGLTRGSHDIEMKGACVRVGPVSIGVCIACGDGKCGSGENRCNCPADCPP